MKLNKRKKPEIKFFAGKKHRPGKKTITMATEITTKHLRNGI